MKVYSFKEAYEMYEKNEQRTGGIGTLGERTLHAFLKFYYDPDVSHHEIKLGSYYADIFDGQDVVEIQTRQFGRLKEKLNYFINECDLDVTVVYPVPAVKYLVWVDPETGEFTSPRKSPRKGKAADVFYELYNIREFISNPRFHLSVLLMELTEYRLADGYSKDGHHGSHRQERIPQGIIDEVYFGSREDYIYFLPGELPEVFTVKEYAKAVRLKPRYAASGITVLTSAGLLERCGNRKKAYLYRRTGELSQENVHGGFR